ncbi:MAG: polysulfide reductase NrfD [Saprospiraceae bacterium]|nr:polysulfide reductase NrfD [Saprospiraceae bacterium]
MALSKYDELLTKFRKPLEKPGRNWWMLFIAMSILVAIGIVALILQIVYGHVITGMRDHVVWGLFIVNFIFFLGMGYAGAIMAAIFHLTKLKWTKPIHRIAEMFALVGSCVGPIFIFLCIGRLDKILNLFIYARLPSPITWDVIAIMTALIFDFTYLYIAHIRDFAKLRDTKVLNLPNWKRNLYRRLSLGYRGAPEQIKLLNQAQNILAVTIIPTAIIAYSLLGWLFGMSLRPGWHSTIFAPEFVIVALYSGIAMLILLMWIYRKSFKLQQWITDQHFQYLGFAMFIFSMAFAYITFSEYITEWYNVSETSGKWISKFLDPSEFGVYSFFTILLAIVIPGILLIIPRLRTPNKITLIAIAVLLGLWIKRYLIIVPTLETPFFPIQDMRPEYVHYSATWIEWALTLGGIALGIIFLMIFNFFAPVVPVSDIEHSDEIVVPKPFYQTLK